MLIGLDISSTSTGIVIFGAHKKEIYGTAIHRLTRKSSKFNRLIHPKEITDQIINYLKPYMSNEEILVGCEEYYPTRDKKAGWVVPWIQGYIVSRLEYKFNIKTIYIHSKTWKYHLIGEKTRGKEKIEDSIMDIMYANNWILKTDVIPRPDKGDKDSYQDVLDAFGVGYYVLSGTVKKQSII